jgi:phage-related protein
MALISVTISGNAAPLKKSVDEAEGTLSRFGGSAKKFGLAAAAGIAAAGAAAVIVGKQLIAAGEAASTSNARIRQISESMGLFGDQAGAVTDRLVKLAEQTARNTGVDQNAIKATQAKLLTFGELAKTAGTVGGEFDRATKAAVDLAAAGFGEASANAVQLGKALQDPIKGITALAKSGVTFTEAEKARIETLVQSNQIGEAQRIVLDAIEKQVGGTAEATANASDRMRVAFSQVQEKLGGALLPIFERFTKFLIDDVFPAVQALGDKIIPIVSDALAKLGDFISNRVVPIVRDRLLPIFREIVTFIVERVVPTVMDLWKRVFTGLAGIFETVTKKIEENRANIDKLVRFFRTLAEFIIGTVAPVLLKTLSVAFGIVAKAVGPVLDVVFALMGAFASLGSFLVKIAKSVVGTIEGMVNGVISLLNFVIRAANKIPGVNINPIGEVSFAMPSFSSPEAPTAAGAAIPDRLDRMAGAGTPSPLTIPSIPPIVPPSTGGGGGGGSRTGSGGGGGGGGSYYNDFSLGAIDSSFSGDFSGLQFDEFGNVVNITVNTVTADSNLPTLIVEALQTYNVQSGPIDVAIAV